MDSWERFDKDTLPPKKEFYSNFNLEDITDKDYKHTQKVWNTLNIKNLDEYHDICSIRHITACRHIRKVSRNMHQNISTRPCTFSIST